MDTIATRRPTRQGAALGTVLAVLFLTFLDTTIVSVTLGNIQYHLGSGVIPLQWVVNAYSLVFASLMLLAGSSQRPVRPQDVHGRRHRRLLRWDRSCARSRRVSAGSSADAP